MSRYGRVAEPGHCAVTICGPTGGPQSIAKTEHACNRPNVAGAGLCVDHLADRLRLAATA